MPPPSQGLLGVPNAFSAARLACDCFGIGLPELQHSLSCLRAGDSSSAERFPKNLSREEIKRAASGRGRWAEALYYVAMHAFYHLALRKDESTHAPMRAHFAQDLVRTLVFLYERLSTRLAVADVCRRRAMRVLTEDVFLPVVFVKLEAARRPNDRTPELDPTDCWYVPRLVGKSIEFPFQRVLKLWMNSIGHRSSFDFGKDYANSPRRKMDQWLSGESVPSPASIWNSVNDFQGKTRDLGSAEDWKARLVLASATSRLWKRVDEYFVSEIPRASLHFGGKLAALRHEGVAIDANGQLFQEHTFFVARLLQRRWRETGEWHPQAIPPSVADARQVDADDTGCPGGAIRGLVQPEYPGDLFLAEVNRRLEKTRSDDGASSSGLLSCEGALSALGVEELNRILSEQKASGH